MEFYPRGSLHDEVLRHPFGTAEVVSILEQISSALAYTHQLKIAHRDIKPANILVKTRDPLDVALADFGEANANKTSFTTMCGTLLYCAPKQLHCSNYGSLVDIWSLRVVGLEFAYGLPTISLNGRKLPTHIPQAMILRMSSILEENPQSQLNSLPFRMLQDDPYSRPKAQECQHILSEICESTLQSSDVLHGTAGSNPTVRITRFQSKHSSLGSATQLDQRTMHRTQRTAHQLVGDPELTGRELRHQSPFPSLRRPPGQEFTPSEVMRQPDHPSSRTPTYQSFERRTMIQKQGNLQSSSTPKGQGFTPSEVMRLLESPSSDPSTGQASPRGR